MSQELPKLQHLWLNHNSLISLYGLSKNIDENVDVYLDFDKLDKYGQEFAFDKLDKYGQEFARGCFKDKKHYQCEQMHEYYAYSDSELTNLYVSGNMTKEFIMNTSEEMKRKLPERLTRRLDYEIEKTLNIFEK